ncbi:MAG: LicD family protein [Sphaerochaetaceae bacterium]|nr:LicD family protein [Sphaerochaetaceae bacterium]
MEETLLLRDIQLQELNILIDVARICEENNIRYTLAYGTLIGAVRHKGFIPWDDDIDVAVPRDDYNRLKKYFAEHDTKYKVFGGYYSLGDCTTSFMKVCNQKIHIIEKGLELENGLGIDIFPIDGFGDDEEKAKKIAKRYWFLVSREYCLREPNNPYIKNASFIKKVSKRLLNVVYRVIGIKNIEKKIEKLVTSNSFDDSKWTGNITAEAGGFDSLFDTDVYRDFVDVEFEGHLFKSLKKQDEYLTRIYGDYMKLPPESEREGKHELQVRIEK